MNIDTRKYIRDEVGKCSFCGFCEYVCPTYIVTGNRLYSPRGRINLIKKFLDEGGWGKSLEESIYTCLFCKACESECRSEIKIVDVILKARNLLIESIKVKLSHPSGYP